MVICFESSGKTRDQLDQMVREGGYQSYGDAISSAVENWLVIHRQVRQNSGVVFLDGSETPLARKTVAPDVPDLFRSIQAPVPDDAPENEEDRDGEYSPDQWLFGQFNKLLPLKVNCRAFANLLAKSPEGVALDEATAMIATAAAELAKHLARLDDSPTLVRGDALAIAFPDPTDRQGKSKLRYGNQFVGAITKQRLTGLMAGMRMLILRNGERQPHVLLTRQGWAFARMRSPVLDEGSPQKFLPEERAFLLDHVARFVPNEASAWNQVLRLMASGHNTPDALDSALAGTVISKAHLTTQRSGVISRMSDLELLRREKTGLFVTYQPTAIAAEWMLRV